MEIRRVEGQLLDNKLLAALVLNDDAKVAIVAGEADVSLLIRGLKSLSINALSMSDRTTRRSLMDGLALLQRGAFGPPAE